MDIKLVEHAKDYIDDLANGINPFTKEEVNENDIVNNVKISRCLFYVSDLLKEIIENEGIKKHKNHKNIKHEKPEFSTANIDLSKIEYSATPLKVSEIVKKLNALKPEEMKGLKVTAITNWLVDINLLYIETINGKRFKLPTSEGVSMGIMQEDRQGQYGVYHIALYSEEAQHFIVDNLDAIINGGYNGPPKDNSGKPWTSDEEFLIKSMLEEGADVRSIAVELKRSVSSIKARIKLLELGN